MASVGRLNYALDVGKDREFTYGHEVHITLSQGLNDGSVLSFRSPKDIYRHTDLNNTLLEIQFKITKQDLSPVADLFANERSEVFLDCGGLHSLFSTVELYLNDQLVTTMNSYPWTSTLCRYIGTSKDIREQVWDTLDGTAEVFSNTSSYWPQSNMFSVTNRLKQSTDLQTYKGRIFVDLFTSVRQLLPPGVSIRLDMRRGADHIALASKTKDTKNMYRVQIEKATLILDRIQLSSDITARSLSFVNGGNAHLVYNALEVKGNIVDKGEIYYTWLNLTQGGPFPNRMYFVFVNQETYYGNLNRMTPWFENANCTSLQLKLDGKPLLVEPIKTRFLNAESGVNTDESDGKQGFLSLCNIFSQISDPMAPLRLSYREFMQGASIWSVELSKCGQREGYSGNIDLELTFGTNGCTDKMVLLMITERSNAICIPNL